MKHEVSTHSIGNTKVCKSIITLLLVLFTGINGFAQQFIDVVNAPLNPIGYIENKNQLNLKGDIAFYKNGNGGFIYFDKNGQRVFNLVYTLYTNEEKARVNRGTYLELDNQKKVVYKENFYFDSKTFYTYNPNGTISKIEVQGKYPSVTTYEYDNKKRMVKEIEQKNAKTTVTAYTYQTTGNSIVISASETVKENNQSKSRTLEYAYENGLLMKFTENGVEDNNTYTYDSKGNWVTRSFRFGNVNEEFYYHSELGQWDKWRWIYKKAKTTYLPYMMVGDRQIRMLPIGFNDLNNFTDILIYEPLTATMLVAENAITTNGLSQGVGGGKIRTLKAKNLSYTTVKGNIKFFVEGDNKSGNLKQVFMGKTYVIYDASSSLTYWCRDFEKGEKFNVFEDLGKDALLWVKNEKNAVYFWQKGDYVSTSGYTLGETLNDGSKLLYKNQKPALVLENFTTSAQNTFYKAVPYAGQAIPKNNTTPANSNTSKQTHVQNEIAEKPGASFNSSLPLYVKEVSNGVYYFYQNDKRIQDPIYHQPKSMYKNRGIECYYRTDKNYYFYVPGTEKPNANGKYPMFGLRGKYIYTTISKEEQKFVFEGKTLKPQEYDLIVSREKNCVLLLKEKGLMFKISSIAFPKQNETVTHSASNSDALGSNSNIFIVFKENGEMVVVEKGKVQPRIDWKLIKENNYSYFLINNVDGRKYKVRNYSPEKTGIVEPQFINLLQ